MEQQCGFRINMDVAVQFCKIDILVQILKAAKLNDLISGIDLKNKQRQTALLIAAEKGQRELFNVLCSHGATLRVQDYAGNTTLTTQQ